MSSSSGSTAWPSANASPMTVGEFIVLVLVPHLLLALGILVLTWLVSLILVRAVKSAMRKVRRRKNADSRLEELVGSCVRATVWFAGIIMALNALGLDITSLVFSAGILALAVSLALKDTLSHILAGVNLLWNRPIDIGDNVALLYPSMNQIVEGNVVDMQLRYTTLRTKHSDEVRGLTGSATVMVPNSLVLGAILMRKEYDVPTLDSGDELSTHDEDDGRDTSNEALLVQQRV